jgi:integrase
LDGLAVKPTTLDNYRTAAQIHTIPRLGGVALADLTAEHVDALYRELERRGKAVETCRTAGVTCKASDCAPARHEGLAPKSVRHVHTMLRKSLPDAVERGYLGRNVCDLANPPTQRDARGRRARDKAWTVDQLRTFLSSIADDRHYALWLLIASTGMRRREACGLRWDEVDLDRGRVRVARTITEVRGRLVVQDDGKSDAAERSIALERTLSRPCEPGGPYRAKSGWPGRVTGSTPNWGSPARTALACDRSGCPPASRRPLPGRNSRGSVRTA